MYLNRVIISGRLTEEPIYKNCNDDNQEEYAILKCHTEKPIRIKGQKSKEDVYFEVIAFGNNASSIKGRVYKGTPLIFELEIRNFDTGKGKVETVLKAVRIHFHERQPRRIDISTDEERSMAKDFPEVSTTSTLIGPGPDNYGDGENNE